jgi:hypothetical protein
MLTLINIVLTNCLGYCVYLIVKKGRERFNDIDERINLLEHEFLSMHKKWKSKND